MDLNISGQYKSISKEQERIRKMIEKSDRKLLLLGKYLKHVEDIKAARKEKKLIPMKEVFRELNL